MEEQQFNLNSYELVEDEELDEIEYFEILTLDEIAQKNPTFLAFSKEEIFDELYSFFRNSNKSDAISEMFFKQKNDKDISNYVFITDGTRKYVDCNDIEDFVSKFNALEKTQYTVTQNEKNKMMFAVSYDSDSKKLRIKPHMKTTIEIHSEDFDKELNIYYPVSEQDDTNIPIIAAYYKRPTSTLSDLLSRKISSKMEKPELMNYRNTDAFLELNDLIKAIKPKITDIMKSFNIDNDNFDMDYQHIDSLLSEFNSSLDEINVEDFKVLKSHIETNMTDIEPQIIKYNKINLNDLNIQNNKLSFYSRLFKTQNPLNIEDKSDVDELIMKLQEEKMELAIPPLLYTNMIDIINAVSNEDITIEVVVENIMKNREGVILDNIIDNLQNFSKNDFDNYKTNLQDLFDKFSKLKNIYHDMYELRFLNFYHEHDEIQQSNDMSSYEGIPDIYRNETTYEGNTAMDEYIIEDIPLMKFQTDVEKFWLKTKYKDNVGFVELLKIVLPIIQNIEDIANININFELLSDELFKHFAGIPTKIHLLNEQFKKNDILIEKKDIEKLVKIKPNIILNSTDSNLNFVEEVKECNKQFLELLYKMIYTSITWLSIQLQSDIIQDILVFDENNIQISYVEKWSDNGFLTNISKEGTLAYLSAISEDVFAEIDIYNVPKNIISSSKEVIENIYQEQYKNLKEQSVKIQKKMNKGDETRKTLRERIQEMKDNKTARQNKNNIEKLLNGYIDALMYMPSYKYQKIHKFLLGCCLQEIGTKFVPYMDFDKMGRTDLISAKLSYAKNRMTNKTSYPLYYIMSDKTFDLIDNTKPFVPPTMFSSEDKTVDKWLNEMKDMSLLLPSNIIEDIQNDASKVENSTILHLKILTKTSGYKNKNDLNSLLDTYVSKSNIFKLLRKQLLSFATENTNEKMLLDMAISELQIIDQKLKELTTLYNEYNEKDIDIIHKYILTRSLCLPFNPDIAQNNILKSSIEVSGNFVESITKRIYVSVVKYLNAVKMPSEEENLDFVNKLREKNKEKKLSFMNQKTQEERELYDQFKQIGIKHDNFETEDYDEESKEDNKIIYDNIEMNDGENDFLVQNDDEYDDDNLDHENYGFLHD